MSSPFSDPTNPYAAASTLRPVLVEQRRLPRFKTAFIIDLVMCSFRLLFVPLSIIGMLVLPQEDPNNPLIATVPFEILTGIGIALFGIPANALMLAKKPLGISLGYG